MTDSPEIPGNRKSDTSMAFDWSQSGAQITPSLYRAALDAVAASVLFLHAPSLRVADANSAAAKMMGVPGNWLCGRKLTECLRDQDRARLSAAVKRVVQSGTASPVLPIAIHGIGPDESCFDVTIRPLPAGCQDFVLVQLENIGWPNTLPVADRVRDPVTALAGRAAMERLLYRAAQGNRPFAILFVDLDGFKKINDTLGHPTGDRVLHIAAQRMRRSLRPTESVGRWGGDEFLVLVEEYEREEDLPCLAQRICRSLKSRFNVDGHNIQLSASVGIAIAASRPVSIERLVRQADEAMYRAKNSRRAYCLAKKPENVIEGAPA